MSSATIDYTALSARLEKDLAEYQSRAGLEFSLPSAGHEQGLLSVEFKTGSLDELKLGEITKIFKKHIPNVRIHTWEEGYWSLQALHDNLFETQGLTFLFKMKVSRLSDSVLVVFTKKGDYSEDEYQVIVGVFKALHPAGEAAAGDPTTELRSMGITVFTPESNAGLDWSDFAGYESTKTEIKENILLPFKNPDIYDAVSQMTRKKAASNRPGAVLFTGQPGVGKTTMARIVAAQTKVPLVYAPVESIMSKYFGESSRILASVFELTGRFESAVLFLDEIDALAGSRDQNLFEATRRVLSVLLRKMDGLDYQSNVLVLGATNRKQDLDAALLSRFDLSLHFPPPAAADRSAILAFYAKHLSEAERSELAERTDGLTPRDLKDACEMAERRWAHSLIQSGREASAPPAGIYAGALQSVQDMKMSG